MQVKNTVNKQIFVFLNNKQTFDVSNNMNIFYLKFNG